MLLAASGSAFQMYFRNSLAEPGIIGISAGATLGAVIAQSFGIATIAFGTISSVNVFAFLGAIIAGGIITLLSTRSSKDASVTLLLCGSALGLFYSSISSIILLTKTKELHGIYTWILGSFNGRSWQEVFIILVPSVVAIAILLFSSGKLDLMAGGETSAKALGLDTKKLKIVIIIAASLAVSASVCAGGTINFIGLIAPHIVRKIYGTKGKTLIPISMVYGAILLLLSDTIARTIIAPAELPAGLITSLLGVPFFISLIFSKQKRN
jgi:iron complex transport system permease protein